MRKLGIYIHIPFCKSLCLYGDFDKVRAGDEHIMRKYTNAVKESVDMFAHKLTDGCGEEFEVDTIYFGGGTPSVMAPFYICEMLQSVYAHFTVCENPEITVEVNPASDLESFLPSVCAAGVNRVSLGMQSSSDSERKVLGRTADSRRVGECIDLIRKSGVENISLDVMLGIPNQTVDSLAETLEFCISHNVPHVSAYMLKIEEGTNFYKRRDSLNLPDEEEVCRFYELTCDTLEASDIMQYEISNFAKPGYASRHNLKYWNLEAYLGIGPGAHSFIEGKRFFFKKDIDRFIDGEGPEFDCYGGDFEEELMLKLRLREGYTGNVPKYVLEKAGQDFMKPYLESDENYIRLTRKGFLVSNSVISNLL